MQEHNIPITNGVGSLALTDGNFTVTATANGYDASTIDPATVEVVEGTDSYAFTIAATGTLTLHVSDDGTDVGVPVVGATFVRCDAEGNTYGDAITSNDEGNAIFENVPFGTEEEAGPTIYYKQTASDGSHTFSEELQTTTITADAATIEITNAEAVAREFSLTDANYSGLPLADAEIVLTQAE